MRLAIVRLTSLGDIIFCMASLQLIRRRFPDCSITWFADRRFADILDHHPDLDRVVKVDWKTVKQNFSWDGVRREYRRIREQGEFDLAIDLHGMLKSALIARMAGERTCGFHRHTAKEPWATLLYHSTLDVPLEINTVYRYASLAVGALGCELQEGELQEKSPYLFYGEEDAAVTRQYFRRDKKNVIFVTGSTWESRNYPKERFVFLANQLKENVLICYGNEAELATARFIAERSPFVTILPKLSLNQLKAAISQADLLIGGDTGPTHIAWANNVPCVVIFGPTPAQRIYPGPRCRILKSDSPVDERKLDKTDFSIREIPETLVLRQAEELLAG